jgi:hypothetical protein
VRSMGTHLLTPISWGADKKVAPRGSDDAPVSRTGKSSAPHIFHTPASNSYRVHVEGGHDDRLSVVR